MFEEIYDGVLSSFSKTGYLTWDTLQKWSGNGYESLITHVPYDNITLSNKINLLKFNYSIGNHEPCVRAFKLDYLKTFTFNN